MRDYTSIERLFNNTVMAAAPMDTSERFFDHLVADHDDFATRCRSCSSRFCFDQVHDSNHLAYIKVSANMVMTGDMLVSLTPRSSHTKSYEALQARSLKELTVVTHERYCPHNYGKLARMLSIMVNRRAALGCPTKRLDVSACLLEENNWDKAFFDTAVTRVEAVPCMWPAN